MGSAPKSIALCATLLIALAVGCNTNVYTPPATPEGQPIAYRPAPQRDLPSTLPLQETLVCCKVVATDDELPTVTQASHACAEPISGRLAVAERSAVDAGDNTSPATNGEVVNPFRNRTVASLPPTIASTAALPSADRPAEKIVAAEPSSVENPFRAKRLQKAQKASPQPVAAAEPAPFELPGAGTPLATNVEHSAAPTGGSHPTSHNTDPLGDDNGLPRLIAAQNFRSAATATPIKPADDPLAVESSTTPAIPPAAPMSPAPPATPLAALPVTTFVTSPGEPAKVFLLIPVETLPVTPAAAKPLEHLAVLQPESQAPSPLLPLFIEPAPFPTPFPTPQAVPVPETIVDTVAQEAWTQPQLPAAPSKNDGPRLSERVARHMSNNLTR